MALYRRWADARRGAVATLLLAAAALAPTSAQAQAAGSDSGITITGFVIDSIRGGTLRNAIVQLQPLKREAITDSTGRYQFSGVVPGAYTLRVLHPLLDTLGLAVVTPTITPDGSVRRMIVDIAAPPVHTLIRNLCPAAQMLRGPAALIGVVRDPDTELPIDSARVTLLFEVGPDLPGLKIEPAVRQAVTDASGRYRICGLPENLKGKLQVDRRGIATPDIPVEYEGARLALRGLAFSLRNTVVSVARDSGRVERLLTGPARLTGRVLNKQGQGVEGARVTVVGSNSVGLTRSNGRFSLDSLPVGSQVVQVRKLGYSVTERPVELSGTTEQVVEVALEDFVPTLDTLTSTSRRQQDLEKVGFTRRKRSQGGYFFEGEQVNKHAETFSQSLVGFPSLRVVRGGTWGDEYVIQDSRDPRGCVAFFVDGSLWKSMRAGDLDEFVRPAEVEAIEIYRAGTLPGEFAAVGAGRCMTIAVWTRNKIRGG